MTSWNSCFKGPAWPRGRDAEYGKEDKIHQTRADIITRRRFRSDGAAAERATGERERTVTWVHTAVENLHELQEASTCSFLICGRSH